MVMEDTAKPRPTYVLKRGRYDMPDKSQKVEPGVPACLPPLPARRSAQPPGPGALAGSPDNPLTARVAVNRSGSTTSASAWSRRPRTSASRASRRRTRAARLAGDRIRPHGLGREGDARLIVTSATYRQSSQAPDALCPARSGEPAAGTRPAVPAAGRVGARQRPGDRRAAVAKIGGPSVKPYQPAGLWEELAGGAGEGPYVQDKGPNLYRRSLYIYRKRTVPHPAWPPSTPPAAKSAR